MVSRIRRRLFPLFLALLLTALPLAGCAKQSVEETGTTETEEKKPNSSLGLTIGYAEGVTEVEDPDALQKLVDDAFNAAQEQGFELEYKNGAYSTDGVNFDCYIANASSNQYDMFISIYADAELTDELFVSQLLRPGSAFDHVTLNRQLDIGRHRVYVPHTQVTVEDGQQVIAGQITVTMDFSVLEE
jgi:hypothetical protein